MSSAIARIIGISDEFESICGASIDNGWLQLIRIIHGNECVKVFWKLQLGQLHLIKLAQWKWTPNYHIQYACSDLKRGNVHEVALFSDGYAGHVNEDRCAHLEL